MTELDGGRREAMMMRVPGPRDRFVHELVLHDGPGDLVADLVPVVQEAVLVGEPTVLLVREETAAALLDAAGPSPYLVVAEAQAPRRPAAELRRLQSLVTDYAGVYRRVRIVCEVQVDEGTWLERRRQEAAANEALRGLAATCLCAYDRRALGDGMVDDLYATHPLVADGSGRTGRVERNARYQEPAAFLRAHRNDPPDPVERTAPTVRLPDPSSRLARALARQLATACGLDGADVEGMAFAVTEAVTNAREHGRPPVVAKFWALPGRLLVTVTDGGEGPRDPCAGLLRTRPLSSRGAGLWVSHQLVDVRHRRDDNGFTLGLSVTA